MTTSKPENVALSAAQDSTADNRHAIDVDRMRLVLEQITNKWSVLILNSLCTNPSRFNAIKRRLGGITHKALADALKRLERNGLVKRTVLDTMPVGVEYSLTTLGRSLQQPIAGLYDWAIEYGPELEQAQQNFEQRNLSID